jgi:putative transposase
VGLRPPYAATSAPAIPVTPFEEGGPFWTPIDSYVTKTNDKAAALTFMKKALKRHGSPDAITTDGLRSYRAAMKDLGNTDKQEVGRWANNRAENSHLPFR